ncbi:hypothetical protein [Legionella adelaidensis]|nr:hypothetical protein [Legionella adelaidensis]
MEKIPVNNIFGLFILYLLTNTFLLLNYQGIYWDDWVLFPPDSKITINIFKQTGNIFIGYLHVLFQKCGNGIYVYRIVSFFTNFLTGICIYYILRQTKWLDNVSIFFIVLFFLLVPVNAAKIAIVNALPQIFVFVFYFSFLLLTIYLKGNKNFFLRVFILFLFCLSFLVESLLVFYSLVLFYLFYPIYKDAQHEKIFQKLKQFFKKYPDFIGLPFLFFSVKHTFFKPYGLYVSYNSFKASSAGLILKSFKTSLLLPIYTSLFTAWAHLTVFLLVTAIVVFIVSRYGQLELEKQQKAHWGKMLIAGILLFLLAVIPYCAVGKLPAYETWGARHQLLVPLGVAFILSTFVLLAAFIHKKLPMILVCGLVAAFITQGLHDYYKFYLDWFYQNSLVEQFKSSHVIQENTTFVVRDELEKEVWAKNRRLAFYEITGLLYRAFQDNKRLVIHDHFRFLKFIKDFKLHPQYHFLQWNLHPPVYIEFSRNKEPNWKEKFWLFYNNFFDRETFMLEVRDLTKISTLSSEQAKVLEKS